MEEFSTLEKGTIVVLASSLAIITSVMFYQMKNSDRKNSDIPTSIVVPSLSSENSSRDIIKDTKYRLPNILEEDQTEPLDHQVDFEFKIQESVDDTLDFDLHKQPLKSPLEDSNKDLRGIRVYKSLGYPKEKANANLDRILKDMDNPPSFSFDKSAQKHPDFASRGKRLKLPIESHVKGKCILNVGYSPWDIFANIEYNDKDYTAKECVDIFNEEVKDGMPDWFDLNTGKSIPMLYKSVTITLDHPKVKAIECSPIILAEYYVAGKTNDIIAKRVEEDYELDPDAQRITSYPNISYDLPMGPNDTGMCVIFFGFGPNSSRTTKNDGCQYTPQQAIDKFNKELKNPYVLGHPEITYMSVELYDYPKKPTVLLAEHFFAQQ